MKHEHEPYAMADESFDFNITKFLAEQKHLLALEKERFAVEKIKLLEPASNEVATASGEGTSREANVKKAKDDQNAKLVVKSKGGGAGNKENVPGGSRKEPEVEECPVERLLREGSFQKLQVKHSPRNAIENKEEESVKVPEVNEKRILERKKHLHSGHEGSPKTPDRQEQQDEMEQWVSDTFYSYFPSFNKNQNEKKSMLSRARQADYQEYLKNIPQVTTKHQQYMEKFGHQAVQTVNEVGTNTTNNPKSTLTAKNYLSPSTTTTTVTATPNVSFSPHLVTSSSSPAAAAQNQSPSIRKTQASEPSSYMRKGSPRERLIEDLTHTDLSTILTTDTIDRRNRMLAEEESRRKLEYQKELIKQIDEKRKEVERLREKEKLEEEMLTSRLEQQLKTMQLEEELEREKQRSEKIRLANEQNHIRRLQLLSKLENDHKVFNPYDADRKTLSENGKEIYLDSSQQRKTSHHPAGGSGPHPGKDKVYRYFSNSAQNPASFASSSMSSEMEYDSSSESLAQQGNRYQYCKNCRADIDRSFLPSRTHSRHHHHGNATPKAQRKATVEEHHCLNCRKRIEKLCANCDRVLKRSVKKGLCAICQQAMENSRMQKEAQSELKRQRSKLLRSMDVLDDEEDDPRPAYPTTGTSPTNPYKIIDIQYHESDNDHDLAVLNPVIVRNNYKKQPYSVNIDKESLFHPSKKTPEPRVAVNIRNGEVFVDNKLGGHHTRHEDTDDVTTDEMDDRISKYVRHYNTLWMKRGMRKNNLKNGNVLNGENLSPSMMATGTNVNGGNGKLGPLPSLSPPKVYVSDRPDNVKSDAMKTTEKKWDVPAVERTKVSPGSPRVLTQLGAIRKQLQLEQLQMDNQAQQQQYQQDHHN